MTEQQSKKIVLPAYLLRRLEAFRIVKGNEPSYLLRDKMVGATYDFDPWQFFILEMLPASQTLEKLQAAFLDRFDRALTKKELDEFLGSVADRKLFDEEAGEHPLIKPFTLPATYDVEDGKAKARSFAAEAAKQSSASAVPGAPAPSPKAAAPDADGAAAGQPEGDLPAGVQDAIGMDWRTTEHMVKLFDPRPMLRVLTPLLYPIRHIIYVTPLLLFIALVLLYQYYPLVTEDLLSLHANISLAGHLIFVFFTVHVVTTMTAAIVATAYKVSVDVVGLTFTLGFMPRWVLKMTGAERLSRSQTMWLHGSTLISRVVMFSLGSMLWYSTRDQQSELAQTGLLFFFSCAIGLLVEAGNPLIKANGYYLVSAYINEPHLRARAYTALMNKMRGGVYRASDNSLLVLYAILSITYIILIILLAGWMLAKYVIGDLNLGGSAIIIAIGFIVYLMWLNYSGLRKFAQNWERQQQFDRWRNRAIPVGAVEGEVITKHPNYWKWAVLAFFVILLFLPYPYEAGGGFTIYPLRKQVLSTDTPGLIESVYFDGGESVKEGTVLARLAHDDYLAQIKVLTAEIEEQKAVVDNLKTLPKPEEVKLAESALKVQREHEAYSREKEPRLEKLYRAGAVSFEEYDSARKDHLVDVQQVVQKEAELALVKAPVTADQIAAAEAKLRSLREQRATYEAKVERTTLKMPFDGNILTLHLQDKINSYLEKGMPFASLEYTGTVTAQIEIAESDIHFVKIGQVVRARPVSFVDDKDFIGKVTVIDRNVTVKPTGNVVMVLATIDNREGLLKTGMAGQAKIEAVKMPVWKAFTLAIVRFVVINVWSWLP
ncbi:MAG: efflux RND transporter periplasmic adaptor subunit [Proteobacteria bacterium]|nr:efflux RND transporter periplasmic adaptor subunit [Pseudomonadota bacterium]